MSRKAKRAHTEFTLFVNQLCRAHCLPNQRMRNHMSRKAMRVHIEITLFVNSPRCNRRIREEGTTRETPHDCRPTPGDDGQCGFTLSSRFL